MRRSFVFLLFLTLFAILTHSSYSIVRNILPTINQHGGPDAFGYTWIDNDNEPNGPVCNWVDIEQQGTVHFTEADDRFVEVNIPFSFPFYSASYQQCTVSSNGYIEFGSIPLNRMIAPRWRDLQLYTIRGNYLMSWSNADSLVITWNACFYSGVVFPEVFQLILLRDGSIVIQYNSVQNVEPFPQIGQQFDAIGFSINSGLSTMRAIRISRPTNQIPDRSASHLQAHTLSHVYPNPFNATTTVSLKLPESDMITIEIVNLFGQAIVLQNVGALSPGEYRIPVSLGIVPSGVYFLKLNGNHFSQLQQVVYLR